MRSGAEVLEVEVMPDHVHLLAEVPPVVALSRFVQLLKGRSSRLLRLEFAHQRRMPACGARRGPSPRSAARRCMSYGANVESQNRAA